MQDSSDECRTNLNESIDAKAASFEAVYAAWRRFAAMQTWIIVAMCVASFIMTFFVLTRFSTTPDDVIRKVEEMQSTVLTAAQVQKAIQDTAPWSSERREWGEWRQTIEAFRASVEVDRVEAKKWRAEILEAVKDR